MESSADDTTVLIVDDEGAVADAYTAQLRDEYETRTAYGGDQALEQIDGDVDVVLLDRRMPGRSGDEVLERVRERGLDCRVIMVTAVNPDFDIVDMPFEDYLQKPVGRETLTGAIEQQLQASGYDERITKFIEITTKLRLLEQEKSPQELDGNKKVERLRNRSAELQAELDETVLNFEDSKDAFRDLL
jgi:DNA-binding NtrC family response regulator